MTGTGDERGEAPLCSLREAVTTANGDVPFGGCAPKGTFGAEPGGSTCFAAARGATDSASDPFSSAYRLVSWHPGK